MPPQFTGDPGARFNGCMQPVNLNPLVQIELSISSSHRSNTLAGVALVP
jgi:hypothetical protein